MPEYISVYKSSNTERHSAWSESSAAHPGPWGRHRTGKNLGLGHLRRSNGKGRADVWVVVSWKGLRGPSRYSERGYFL